MPCGKAQGVSCIAGRQGRLYTDHVTGYLKGTTPEGEMAHMREAFARATAAIQAWPDADRGVAGSQRPDRAHRRATRRGGRLPRLSRRLPARLPRSHHRRAGRVHGRHPGAGQPDHHPGTREGKSSDRADHTARAAARGAGHHHLRPRRPHRQARDGIPPWTFLGGEIREGESSGDALRRRVQAEAGLPVTSVHFIGRRIHPKTSSVMVYGHVEVGEGEPQLGDPDDLEEVRWVPSTRPGTSCRTCTGRSGSTLTN